MRNTWLGRHNERFGTFTLERDRTLRTGAGLLRVERGSALVTQEGDPRDHVLEAGDELRPAPRGLVVLWALTDAVVTLAPAGMARVAPAGAPCTA